VNKYVLIIILLVASFFRLWNLSNVPPSASLDEASITYNAYSVLETGKDEFGEFPLVSQRGYDDYRRSTYLLMEVPFVKLFGLSTISARLPAALLSIFTVWAVYGIAAHLFKKKDKYTQLFPYFAAGLMAVSPWHIYISRIGHESNACLSFIVFGMYFFLRGVKDKPKSLFISASFFLLGMISYYSGQVFVPVLAVGLVILYRKEITKAIMQSKKSFFATVILSVVAVAIFWSVFSPNALIRYRGTSVFDPYGHGDRYSKLVDMRNLAIQKGDLIGSIIFNRRVFYVQVWMEGYLSHFKPSWLFSNTGDGRFKAPGVGLLYLWQLPFILVGVFHLIRTKNINTRVKILILLWFFLGALPASIATQTPHAMRSYNIVPAWQILTAFGCILLLHLTSKYKNIGLTVIVLLFLVSSVTFYEKYFVKFPKQESKAFQYALAQSIPFIISNQSKYDKVIFSNKDNLYQSYMLFLYHSRYDPKLYNSYGGTISGGYEQTHKFGKYEFRPIHWESEKGAKTIYIGNPSEIPDSNKVIFRGKYLDGSVGVRISEK